MSQYLFKFSPLVNIFIKYNLLKVDWQTATNFATC